jgi:transposase-like protein
MKKISYNGYRFTPEIIQRAIWLYVRFTLSFRDVEDLLAERDGVLRNCSALGEPRDDKLRR